MIFALKTYYYRRQYFVIISVRNMINSLFVAQRSSLSLLLLSFYSTEILSIQIVYKKMFLQQNMSVKFS